MDAINYTQDNFEVQREKNVWGFSSNFSNKTNISKSNNKISKLEKMIFKNLSFNKMQITNVKSIDFFASHAKELLDLAFDTEIDSKNNKNDHRHVALSRGAFLILTAAPEKLLTALMNDFMFFMKATELLSKPRIPQLIASRLATMFTIICNNNDEDGVNAFGLMVLLLKYIEDSAVSNMFHTVCTHNSKKNPINFAILQTDFDVFVINELKDAQSDEQIHNLLLILQDCLKNKTLNEKFKTQSILDQLVNMLNKTRDNYQLCNQVWETLALIVSSKLLSNLQPVFNTAMEILLEPFETLHIFHTAIFDFLTQIVILKAAMFSEVQRVHVCQVITRLCVQFSNSTNLILSIFKFIRSSLTNKDFAHIILNSFVSLFVFEGQSETRSAFSANCLLFLADLERMKTSSIMVNKFLTSNKVYTSFYKSWFKAYLDDLYTPYGGTAVTKISKNPSK